MLRVLLALTAVFLVYKLMPGSREINAPRPSPGVRVSSDPVQRDVGNGVAWTFGKYQITPLASYDIDGVVLSTEPYRLGRESEISPIDFAVAWGSMSDQAIIDQIHFAQGNRFLRFSEPRLALSADEMNSHVANMHLIPATPEIASQFKTAVHGQIVTMSGYLVRVDAQDGFHWVSSMSRTDRGAGACELMWVERFSLR
jgi:hypothetical protein